MKKQPQRQQHAWLAGAATVDSGASLEVRALGTHVVERGEEVGVVEGRDGQLVGGCGAALDVPPGLCHVAAPLLDLRPRAVSEINPSSSFTASPLLLLLKAGARCNPRVLFALAYNIAY